MGLPELPLHLLVAPLLLVLLLLPSTSPSTSTSASPSILFHSHSHLLLLLVSASFSSVSPSTSPHTQRSGILGQERDDHLHWVSTFPNLDLNMRPELATNQNGRPSEYLEDQFDFGAVQTARISLCFGRVDNCQDIETAAVHKRRKRALPLSSTDCHMEVSIEAFEDQLTLCLYRRPFENEPMLRDKFQAMNITVFQEGSLTMEIPLRSLQLNYIAGIVVGERFSSVTGYIQNDHFFGIVHIEDHVHFLEPSLRRSRDLYMYLNGKDRLTHQLTSSGGAPNCQRRQCELTLVADHHFYIEMGQGSLRSTIIQLLWHVKEANKKWATLDLDSDRHSDCLRLSVAEITIFTSPDSSVNLLTGSYLHPEDFLKRSKMVFPRKLF